VKRFSILLLAALAAGCSRKDSENFDREAAGGKSAIPVSVGIVSSANLQEVVSGPGKVVALLQQKVRTPFAGTLTVLHAADGDRVAAGQVIGSVVSRDSEAALSGSREMVRGAVSPAEKSDAERALELAQKNLVEAPIRSSVAGVVLSHSASAGDRVSEDQEIVTIAETNSLVLVADIPQSEVPRIRSQQPASIEFPGRSDAVPATVHDVLASANSTDLTAPVRLDFREIPRDLPVGTFATARITVRYRPGAIVAPESAILRDDVSGVTRMALVTLDGKAHWIAVTPGLTQSGQTEIMSPVLKAGQRVIVGGQIGLPEGAAVSPLP
jgi:multidrug efflux pump subunit AcrA (membrane-fusion protein)